MDGILPLNKDRGMTSNDAVFKCRRLFRTRKVGHSGTLDPNVDGVLPICIGHATKVVSYLMESGKVYTGEVTLGFSTETEDLDKENGVQKLRFKVACGKGTYVRTLATDLGKKLGVPAVMSDLTRLESGSFKLDEAYTLAQLEELKQNGRLEEALRPVDHALKMPKRELTSAQWKIVKNGGFLLPENFSDLSATDGLQVALTYQNKCRCVYRYNEEKRRYQAEQMIDLT